MIMHELSPFLAHYFRKQLNHQFKTGRTKFTGNPREFANYLRRHRHLQARSTR